MLNRQGWVYNYRQALLENDSKRHHPIESGTKLSLLRKQVVAPAFRSRTAE